MAIWLVNKNYAYFLSSQQTIYFLVCCRILVNSLCAMRCKPRDYTKHKNDLFLYTISSYLFLLILPPWFWPPISIMVFCKIILATMIYLKWESDHAIHCLKHLNDFSLLWSLSSITVYDSIPVSRLSCAAFYC